MSVVIPATDAPPTLDRCRSAIAAAEGGPEEVVVVDSPASLSAAAARNAGAGRASGEVIVFVDADVAVHPDAFVRIREAFEADEGLVAIFGSYDDAPAASGMVSRFRNLLHHHVHHVGAGPAQTFWTGLGALRRRAFIASGGFDENRYPRPSIEDVELGDRLCARGLRVLLDPAIQGTHLKRWSLASMVWTDFARRGVPWVELQVRNRRVSSALNCGWRHRLSALVSVLMVVAALAGGWPAALVAAGALGFLNRRFYALLLRRTGLRGAVGGFVLHGLHHLVSVAAVTWGLAWAAGAATVHATGLGRIRGRARAASLPAESRVAL